MWTCVTCEEGRQRNKKNSSTGSKKEEKKGRMPYESVYIALESCFSSLLSTL